MPRQAILLRKADTAPWMLVTMCEIRQNQLTLNVKPEALDKQASFLEKNKVLQSCFNLNMNIEPRVREITRLSIGVWGTEHVADLGWKIYLCIIWKPEAVQICNVRSKTVMYYGRKGMAQTEAFTTRTQHRCHAASASEYWVSKQL